MGPEQRGQVSTSAAKTCASSQAQRALEATFVPERAAGLSAVYDLRLEGERFSVRVDGGNIFVSPGSPRQADAVIATDSATLRAVVFGDRELADAGVEMSGDGRLARRFFRLFARP
jgi:hypothetical protein